MNLTMESAALTEALDQPFALSATHLERFAKFGYVKIPGVLSPELLEAVREPIGRVVQANNKHAGVPIEERDTYGKAFIQVTNIWEQSEEARRFVMGKRLGRIAAELLGVAGVRLYHDQALYKEPSGGITPWHLDQYYWPLATDRTVTVWIPLVEIPIEMGPLSFAAGSQELDFGRDMAISDDSETALRDALEREAYPVEASAYALGEVSFHLGWTAHRAGPNRGERAREVMTMIYMDRDMTLMEPKHENQRHDREVFCPGIEVGAVCDSPKNPIVYEA
ncbi:phytanoyl-CoA dioxygenase family protein [Mucisphaera calidilacus]|uniref:Phytanoyl-CoA dioxygenase (PhyH) n=1 Tax=Mucisphaera calidilacus TaxID=2527982 RepID=A0A518BXM6_9BACT|nr:phytanoyl-CoA dioxygenase family protein [Mucisphaera calidilacus]QDU71706.1 Phytanoyl-CoA dioxygenase (PhyH) [Mucisphaera calidilacus]